MSTYINYKGIDLEVSCQELEVITYKGIDVTDLVMTLSNPARNKAGTIITHDQAIIDEYLRQGKEDYEEDKKEWQLQDLDY